MSNYPYPEPDTYGAPRSVVITDAAAFRMPHKCVVCGEDVPSLLSYTQDHLPLIGPGIGLMRTTMVSLPYCEEHAEAFQRRFRRLRIAQRVAYGVLLVSIFTLFFEPFREMLGWPPEPGAISYAVAGCFFLFLIATIFCIKPFLYDAFVTRSGPFIRIKSRSELFIKYVIEANRQIAQ